jgi:hypothetical protein
MLIAFRFLFLWSFVLVFGEVSFVGGFAKADSRKLDSTPVKNERPLATSMPTASGVKIFTSSFLADTCDFIYQDGWGDYYYSVMLNTQQHFEQRKGAGGCRDCKRFIVRYLKICKKVGRRYKAVKFLKSLEPMTEFLSYLTTVFHEALLAKDTSRLKSVDIKTFLLLLATAYNTGDARAKSYFIILDSFAGSSLRRMVALAEAMDKE